MSCPSEQQPGCGLLTFVAGVALALPVGGLLLNALMYLVVGWSMGPNGVGPLQAWLFGPYQDFMAHIPVLGNFYEMIAQMLPMPNYPLTRATVLIAMPGFYACSAVIYIYVGRGVWNLARDIWKSCKE